MSVSDPPRSSEDFGDAVSAQANEATEDNFDEEDEDEDADNTQKIHGEDSDTIEPNMYNVKPSLQDKFRVQFVKSTIQEILLEELTGKVYSAESAKDWTTNIANIINRKVKEMKWKRYKHIVQVIIGEQRGAGIKSGVKCVWDSETDNLASEVFTNESLFCVAVVFGVYFY